MELFQAFPSIPETQKTFMPKLVHDFRAAISYVSFYPINSRFVTHSVQKLYEDFQSVLHDVQPLVIHIKNEKLYINDHPLSSFDDLLRLLQERNIQGVEIFKDITLRELTDWLQVIALPLEENIEHFKKNKPAHIHPLSRSRSGLTADNSKEPLAFMLNAFESFDILTKRSHSNKIDGFHQNHQALLDFVEETWQFFQTQQKNLGSSPEMNRLLETFDQLFERLLDRMEKPSSEFKNMSASFKNETSTFLKQNKKFD